MRDKDLDELIGKHLVLKSKSTGKVAARPDRAQKALQLEAKRLTESGAGGGITGLLLPKTEDEIVKLEAINRTYEVGVVKARKITRSSDRVRVTVALMNDQLMAELAVLYGQTIEHPTSARKISAQAFLQWLRREMLSKKGPAYLAVRKLAPILLNVERSDRWWGDAISARRKVQS